MDINELLSQYYNENKDDIAFISKGGSSCLSYIYNPHDLDYIIVFKLKDEMQSIFEKTREIRNVIKELNPNAVAIPTYLGFLRYWKTRIIENDNAPVERMFVPIYLYLIKDNQIICGEDTEHLLNISILDNSVKLYYQEALRDFIIHNPYDVSKYFPKSLYHILTGIYILQNNSYELTAEQIENINIAHDSINTARCEELYNWCLEVLGVSKEDIIYPESIE